MYEGNWADLAAQGFLARVHCVEVTAHFALSPPLLRIADGSEPKYADGGDVLSTLFTPRRIASLKTLDQLTTLPSAAPSSRSPNLSSAADTRGFPASSVVEYACDGTGRRAQRVCVACAGEGRANTSETYQVKVPHGVAAGQRLRLAGRGEAGSRGGTAGDFISLLLC
jgi:hypothetical protein